MLSPYRVLDCTDHRGQLAGMMLAQMGAEVISIESQEGSSGRWLAPFVNDVETAETSLWHRSYGRGKRSIVVDPSSSHDQAWLDTLAAGADIVLLSGRATDLWLDPAGMAERHHELVVATLTPFGLDGPKATWNDTDLIVCAAGCQLDLTGNSDLPPLRTAVPQAYLHGAAELAVGSLMALYERGRSGRGQIVDVSAQEAFLQSSFSCSLHEAWQAPLLGRCGEGVSAGPFTIRWGYPASDGEVSITLLFGSAFDEFTPNLFQWIWEEGGCDEATRDKPWTDYAMLLLAGEEPVSELNRLTEVIAAFTAQRTKAELVAEARRRRVLLAPVSTLGEVLETPHLDVRGFWDHVGTTDGGSHRHAGRFLVASATPLRALPAASALGSDTAPILSEAPRRPAIGRLEPDTPAAGGNPLPLDGIKVVDLCWAVSGPLIGRTLSDFGANVVRVESRHRVDVSRTVSPLHPGNEDHPLEGGGTFSNCNAGKLGVELDLRVAAAREVLWDLIEWADVVIESFSAGAFERMGFDYDQLSARSPGVILVSSCLPGQTGPLELPGYGNLSSAMFGFHATTNWPGRPASGPFGAYTDTVAPHFALAGLLGALDHRRRTGQGQHLDISQAESSLHFLAPALLDTEINHREHQPRGNADLQMSPHGVYPASGDDEWIAIAVQSDDEWKALATLIDRATLAELTTVARLDRRGELDDAVAAWTTERPAADVERELQRLDIAAHRVQNSPGCLADPQLRHRRHYVTLDHPLLGPLPVEGPRFALSRTPGRVQRLGPTLGEHTFEVLNHLLGYDEDHIADIAAAQAFG